MFWAEARGGRSKALTPIARELYDRSVAYRRTRQSALSLPRRFEDTAIASMIEGAPVDLAVLRTALLSMVSAAIEDPKFRARADAVDANPLTFDEWVASLSDGDLAETVRDNPNWLRLPAVAARVADARLQVERGKAKPYQRTLEQIVMKKSAAAHRPAAATRDAVRARAAELARGAESIRAKWIDLRARHVDETVIELGRRLHEALEGRAETRLTPDSVKAYLAGLSVVVKARDGKRFVTIEDPGWPRAVQLTLLSGELSLAMETVEKLVR